VSVGGWCSLSLFLVETGGRPLFGCPRCAEALVRGALSSLGFPRPVWGLALGPAGGACRRCRVLRVHGLWGRGDVGAGGCSRQPPALPVLLSG